MTPACTLCGSPTEWEPDIASAVCTSCGELVDPTQVVLAADYAPESSDWQPALKSLRSRKNWDLAGQGKEARERRNAFAMQEFVQSLAVSLNAPGLSPRALNLFNQARSASAFHWGKKSRLVAAACFAIALRDAHRPDSIHDIASLLDVPSQSLSREFISITSLLGLRLSLLDPSVHIPTLEAHLASVLVDANGIPPPLVQTLRPLNMRSVSSTATSLSHLFARLSPEHPILRLPMPATACAMFILALEAETRAVLSLADLAQILGARLHAVKNLVMTRYKTIQDEILAWAQHVPWLDKYESKNGRARVSKRLVAARAIKDVIQFQEQIWAQKKILAPPEIEHSEDEQAKEDIPAISARPSKRRKLTRSLEQATKFLLDPLGTPLSSISTKKPSAPGSSESIAYQLSIASYMLSNPGAPIRPRPPTRLQLLAVERGGSTEDHIPDEELFADDEFEKLFRSEHEIQILQEKVGWLDDVDDDTSEHLKPSKGKGKRERDRDAGTTKEKTSRVNMEALSRFLSQEDSSAPIDDPFDSSLALGLEAIMDDKADYEGYSDSLDLELDLEASTPSSYNNHTPDSFFHTPPDFSGVGDLNDEEVVLQEWHPLTSDAGYTNFGHDGSRYEEERPP